MWDKRYQVLDGRIYFYSTFYIGPASDGYRISLCGHSGNTTDAFGFMHNNMRFSTHERDQDLWDGGNCAKDYGGGWWFNNCLWSNLNGVYGEQYDGGVTWFHQQFPVKDLRMKYVEMKFRKSNIWQNYHISGRLRVILNYTNESKYDYSIFCIRTWSQMIWLQFE